MGEGIKKLKVMIAKAAKFFSTLVGQIVFYGIAILLLALLVYIIVSVLLKDIAKILGVEGGSQTGNESYEFLKDLTDSGYDEMLDSKELVEYYAFEYAVLMDAARFMEETGTGVVEAREQNPNPVDFENMSPEEWALRQAMTNFAELSTEEVNALAQELGIDLNKKKDDKSDPDDGSNGEEEPEEDDKKKEKDETEDFNTDYTKENLVYYPVYNEYTGEYSLYPYLEITRKWHDLTYHIEIVNDENVKKDGVNYKVDLSKYGENFRFQAMQVKDAVTLKEAYYQYLNNVKHARIVTELNASNRSAYEDDDMAFNSNPEDVDLYKEYSESLYYSAEDKSSLYKIPLKVLLERFMPNAVLLSSWKILSDDSGEETGDDVVAEIQKIYSEACLEGETISGDKLLVKDVHQVSTNIDENTKAQDLYDKTLLQDTAKETFIDGSKTLILYSSYEALYDSRVLDPNRGEEGSKEGENKEPEEPEEPEVPDVPEAPEGEEEGNDEDTSLRYIQKFEGGFSGDLMDDVKLVLKHYSDNSGVTMNLEVYNKLLEDVERVIEPKESEPISDGEYIIYTPLANGSYLVDCTKVNDDTAFRNHYGLASNADVSDKEKIMKEKAHKYAVDADPYSAPSDIKECFVPFMKIAFTHEEGLRMTSIIICYNEQYEGYLVKGKEITDLAAISNKKTFAHFEVADIQSTIFREWVYAVDSVKTLENWVVEDAFEGLALDVGEVRLTITYDMEGIEGRQTITARGTLAELEESLGLKLTSAEIATALLGKEITEEAILGADSDAIIRTPEDPLSRNYEGLLKPPTNANPSSDYEGYGGESGTVTASIFPVYGETNRTEVAYVNLKAAGYTAEDEIIIDESAVNNLESKLKSKMSMAKIHRMIINRVKQKDVMAPPEETGNIIEQLEYYGISNVKFSFSAGEVNPTFSVVFPTRCVYSPITQIVTDKQLNFYLVRKATTWSGVKKYNNDIVQIGDFNNRNNIAFIYSNNADASGLYEYNVTKEYSWRTKLFAPIFAGRDDAKTTARETDVLLVMSQWQEASDSGVRAADYYIRDLYALINYSKGIEAESGDGLAGDGYDIKPVYKSDGKTPYINSASYTYLYVPEEILGFDETVSERAFWLDRIISTLGEDQINENTENYLRSKKSTFTWQIVDYALYEECLSGDGVAQVYALWPYGNQLSTSLYVFASNHNQDENDKVMSSEGTPGWGGYSLVHRAADLAGRGSANEIYTEIFGKNGDAIIKANYKNGKVTLENTDQTNGVGLYFNNDGTGEYITMKLGDEEYRFKGSAAAVYGYELYRLTLTLKDPVKAEEMLKEQLLEEMLWCELRAIAPGIVTDVKGNSTSGFRVEITHSDGTLSSYCHMKRYPQVQVGDYVGAGTLLGYEGTTGKSKGNHVHMSVKRKGIQLTNPIECMYPFFTPFYYEEKAAEAGYNLDSEYMSLQRTVFPYGQYSGVVKNNYWTTDVDEEGFVKIKNYVPNQALVPDATLLYDETAKGYIDYVKLPVEREYVKTGLGGSNYTESKLETIPLYFEEEFMYAVAANGNKIKGAGRNYFGDKIYMPWDVKGGLTTSGTWEYVWVESPLKEKPMINRDVKLTETDYQKFDAELERQVDLAGPGTRAAVVVTARYLAGFPYTIPYLGGKSFAHNVGFYGHHGISRGWGEYVNGSLNGIDCTGFTNWVLVNAGVAKEGSSMGASNAYNSKLSGPERRTYLFSEAEKLGIEVKPGDFIHIKNENYDPSYAGGVRYDENGKKVKTSRFTHIGIIIGIDEEYYYVAEAVNCTIVRKYRRGSDLFYVTLCDNLYSGEGTYDDSEIFPETFKMP